MSGGIHSHVPRGLAAQSPTDENPLIKWLLIGIALSFVTLFLLIPLLNVFYQALTGGLNLYIESLRDPDTLAAVKLSFTVALVSVPLNLVFGIAAAWAIAKFDFRGKAFLITLIDLPFAISPVVAGLMLVLLFGRQGIFANWVEAHDLKIIFAVPGIILATIFVTFPFVARELIPVMQATGSEQEQAALTLGASGWQTFWHVTLPSVKWGIIYGVILCNARALGEFGAVSVVSGHITGLTDTMPLRIDKLYHGGSSAAATAAFAVASLLTLLALFTLAIKTFLEFRTARKFALAQHGPEPTEAHEH